MSDSQMLKTYQKFVTSVDLYPHEICCEDRGASRPDIVTGDSAIALHSLGLCGEAGEIANKIKKIYRDNNGSWDDAFEENIKKELGDAFWYLTALCEDFGFELEDVIR